MSGNASPSASKGSRAIDTVNSVREEKAQKRPRSSKATKSRNAAATEHVVAGPVGEKDGRSAGAKKVDRRVRATRDALGDAIVALIQEQPFEAITVQQVLDRAKVSRSTFYSHYSDKNDLFLSDAEEFFEMASTALLRHGDTSNRIAPVQEFFAHLAEWRKFYSAMVTSGKVRDVMDLGLGHFARGIDQRLAAMASTRNLTPLRRSALAHASAGALFSLLSWWLDHGASASPAQMDALYHEMVWAGVNPPAAPAHP